MTSTMSEFVRSYVETALWSSNDESGTPLDDAKYADCELAPETLARMTADCAKFEDAACKIINAADYVMGDFPVAHDFWLTRNHHGAGFWDGDYPEAISKQLTDLAHSYGQCDLYVGDDNQIHAM